MRRGRGLHSGSVAATVTTAASTSPAVGADPASDGDGTPVGRTALTSVDVPDSVTTASDAVVRATSPISESPR
jgi:hypothetical protein